MKASELSAIRRDLGMTIAEMAAAVDLKPPTYYYYESRFARDDLPGDLADKVQKLMRSSGRRRREAGRAAGSGAKRGRAAPAPGPDSADDDVYRQILATLRLIEKVLETRGRGRRRH